MSYLLLSEGQRTDVDLVHINGSCLLDLMEYRKAHWWVSYDEQPGVVGMFDSVCERWPELSKGNCVHLVGIKASFKTWKGIIRNYLRIKRSK